MMMMRAYLFIVSLLRSKNMTPPPAAFFHPLAHVNAHIYTTNNRPEAKIMRHVFLYNRCRYSHEKKLLSFALLV